MNSWTASRLDDLDTDFVMPVQFFESATDGEAFLTPERLLMLAVLQDALSLVRNSLPYSSRRAQRLGQEATAWIFSEETQWPYAFLPICHQLHINPAGLRRLVKEALAGTRPMNRSHTYSRGKGLNADARKVA